MDKSTKKAAYIGGETEYNELEQQIAQPLFENLIWLTTEEAGRYIRKSANAIRIAVHKGHIHARKFRRRLYFKKDELDLLIDTSNLKRS